MNRNSQRGVALAVTRRERGSTKLSESLADADFMASAALARAQAQLVAQMMATTNRLSYDLAVSTNFINPRGFRPQRLAGPNPTNVSYVYANGNPVTGQDLLQNIANLQYDARAPVFVPTNEYDLRFTEFRYYLDLNRNGMFETNGRLAEIGFDGSYFSTNGLPKAQLVNVLSNNFVGDPEWIGVLEHPDQPHSETNRFVGRYAYLVLPAGKTLDLNFVHNQANPAAPDALTPYGPGGNGYFRNQGVGSWELNLAGFLRDLNTNNYAWPAISYLGFNPASVSASTLPTGVAFEDARELLGFRYADTRRTLKPIDQVLSTNWTHISRNSIDDYGDGPFNIYNGPLTLDNDRVRASWSGSDNTNAFFDVQQLLTTPNISRFSSRLRGIMTPNRLSTYDRYTFYRLLGQMGMDSTPALKSRININYVNEPGIISTNIANWTPTNFFIRAADAMLKASLFTNITQTAGGRRFTNWYIGETLVRPDISITNIQIYFDPAQAVPGNGNLNTNSEYTASIHRILQVAANIYDATANISGSPTATPYLPTVFRPIFTKTSTNIYISGYLEATNSLFLNNPWYDLPNFFARLKPAAFQDLNVFGQPIVIGAKKGYPNFNEFTIQSLIQVSRKLEVGKLAVGGPPAYTNQMYILGISNIFGLEAWNSYTQAYTRPFELRVTNRYSVVLSNIYNGGTNQIFAGFSAFGLTTNSTFWPGNSNAVALGTSPNSFIVPYNTNITFMTNLAYAPTTGRWFVAPGNNFFGFDRTFNPPEWQLYFTNRMTYIMIDKVSGRVVDFVNLDNLTNSINITALLTTQTNISTASAGYIPNFGRAPAGSAPQANEGDFWITNRLSILAPTAGHTNQMAVSLRLLEADNALWQSFLGAAPSGKDKDNSITAFRIFMGLDAGPMPPSLSHQAPFTPTRRFSQVYTWQANDPLVHYVVADLLDPILNNPTNAAILKAGTKLPESNIGKQNERYRPWGGNPVKTDLADTNSFNMAVKDPRIYRSDDWEFPENSTTTNLVKFPSIGWLGRIHRGTPWQTIYLKSQATPPLEWQKWSGSLGTAPTNDWKFLDLFTVALHENSARGLLSVNQTNLAAWSATLSGVGVLTNTLPNPGKNTRPGFRDIFIEPGSPQLRTIVAAINQARTNNPGGVFTNMGSVLSAPELSIRSPYLNTNAVQLLHGLTDEAVERIPRQILSLLKEDEPRVVVYSFGQALKPAPRSLVTEANFYHLCTNYQVSGEVVTKTILRFEGDPQGDRSVPPNPLRTVIESHVALPPE